MVHVDYQWAEDSVAADLQQKGWYVLARNYRGCGFELDIVAYRGLVLCITEVKLRRFYPRCGAELNALLGPRKRQALWRGSQSFLTAYAQLPYDCIRIDLALVQPPTKLQKNDPAGSQKTPPIVYYKNVMPLISSSSPNCKGGPS